MRKRVLFYFLCLLSSILSALVVIIDTIASVYVDDIWIYANLNFVVGTIISFFIVILFLIPVKGKKLGRYIDPNFYGIMMIRREHIKYFAGMALGNAIATIGYFYIITTLMDPSAILPFMQIVILYLVLGEIIFEKDIPTLVETQSLTMIVFGVFLTSISPTGEFNIPALITVMTLINGGSTLKILIQRKLRTTKINKKRIDSINIRLWNLALSTLFFLLIMSIMDPKSITGMLHATRELILITTLSMIVTFFAKITYIRALGIGRASITQAVSSVTVILGIPFTLITGHIIPGVFAPLAATHWIFLIKIIGTIMVALGITVLALSEVKSYILIKAPKGKGQAILKKLLRIKGIISVSALAGKYDYIAKVRTRTLGKAYRLIVRELEKIPGIEDFMWLSILYEWEEV